MGWLEKIKHDGVFVDFGGDLAVKLLPEHAAAAEEAWKRTTNRGRRAWRIHGGERGVQLADVCYRLASIDRPRAERIARNTDEWPLRVRALGAIAFRLAESDAAGARKLLESIVREALPHPVVDNEFEPFGYAGLAAPLTAAWLLPIAERIDPQLGRECFWRSLALRPARPRHDQLDDQDAQIDIELTMMLSRYDRRVARSLLDPLIARLPELARCGSANVDERHARGVCTHAGSEAGTIIAAAIHVDPRWAAEVFESTSKGDGESMRRFRSWLRDDWIGALSRHGIDRWEQEDQIFSAYFANYWRPKPEE
ncbi:MAG TPA: hypothetical protein VHC19_28480 [Pirellulales bacterium]|nr:hypothetical protein [Pirellulales bacterium]